MVAGVIRALGVNMGHSVGHNHEDPRFISEDPQDLKNYVAERNNSADIWGFKMPKAANNLDFWDSNLRNPVYVIAYRNPLAIADSWIQRESGQLLGIMNRVQSYQSAVLSFLETTRSPVLLVNYERAVQNKSSGMKFVEELTSFLRLDVTESTRETAVGMITGDGGGYVDLPEAYFAMQRTKERAETNEISTVLLGDQQKGADGWIKQSKPGQTYPHMRSETGEALPRFFRLELEFEPGKDFRVGHDNIIMHYNLVAQQTEWRAIYLELQPGLNRFDVETSGELWKLAFKSSKCPSHYRLDASILEPVVDVVEDDQSFIVRRVEEKVLGRFQNLKRHVSKRLRK